MQRCRNHTERPEWRRAGVHLALAGIATWTEKGNTDDADLKGDCTDRSMRSTAPFTSDCLFVNPSGTRWHPRLFIFESGSLSEETLFAWNDPFDEVNPQNPFAPFVLDAGLLWSGD
jgi:hypothetical protein